LTTLMICIGHTRPYRRTSLKYMIPETKKNKIQTFLLALSLIWKYLNIFCWQYINSLILKKCSVYPILCQSSCFSISKKSNCFQYYYLATIEPEMLQ
jgi:hypothetical protein